MIWWDHVFNFGPKSATRVTKFWEKNWRGASRDSFFLEILSLGQFVAWGESGTFCHLGQFVAQKMPVGQLVVGTKCLLTFQSRKQILTLRGVYVRPNMIFPLLLASMSCQLCDDYQLSVNIHVNLVNIIIISIQHSNHSHLKMIFPLLLASFLPIRTLILPKIIESKYLQVNFSTKVCIF